MKKIISALTLGALIGAAAFADVEIKLNLRQRANLFAAANIAGAKTEKAFGFLDAYSGNGTDNMAISLSGDIAAFDATLVTDENTTSKIRAKVLMGSLFLGPVTLRAGFNADGILNGAYRAKSDLDFGNFEGMDFEFKKLGSAFAASPAFFADNLIGSVNGKGKEHFALMADYGLKFDKGAATLRAAMVTNETSDYAYDPVYTSNKEVPATAHAQGHQFSFIADGRMDGIGQAEVVFKVGEYSDRDPSKGINNNSTAMAFALYAQPTINKNLILTAGGAVGVVDYDVSDVSFDLRARYQAIPKKLSITSFHSFSYLVGDGADDVMKVSNKTTKGIANNDGLYGAKGTDGGKHGGTQIERNKILSNNLMVRYNVNDTLTVYAIAADMIGFGKSMDSKTNKAKPVLTKDGKNDDAGAQVQLRFSGWAQFFATSAASINVGLVCSVDDVGNQYNEDDHHCSWYWSVPMILRIKF
ncbi:MAG: hypothetical protein K2K67_06725 [Treponemataceae bacterium]|nr:hypothetical protein [Treponemataceae bacterium]